MTFPLAKMRIAALISIIGLCACAMTMAGCESGDETVSQKSTASTANNRSSGAKQENGPEGGTTTASTEEVQTDLRNAAVAMESYFTDHTTYATSLAELEAAGYRQNPGVILTIDMADSSSYCINAAGRGSSMMWHFDSTEGSVSAGSC